MAIVVLATTLALPTPVVACVCVGTPDIPTAEQRIEQVHRELDKALAVFSGQVIGQNALSVRFRVDTVWKGDVTPEFQMSNGATVEGPSLDQYVRLQVHRWRQVRHLCVRSECGADESLELHVVGGSTIRE